MRVPLKWRWSPPRTLSVSCAHCERLGCMQFLLLLADFANGVHHLVWRRRRRRRVYDDVLGYGCRLRRGESCSYLPAWRDACCRAIVLLSLMMILAKSSSLVYWVEILPLMKLSQFLRSFFKSVHHLKKLYTLFIHIWFFKFNNSIRLAKLTKLLSISYSTKHFKMNLSNNLEFEIM